MLNLTQLERIRLRPKPVSQLCLKRYFLAPQYVVHPRVKIDFEGYARVPKEPVIFAMNHTDYYTFFPFMYQLIIEDDRYTSAWVKGKNYDNPFMAKFMEVTNNIPVPSRGYILARDFTSTMERRPTDDEYTALRRWVDDGVAPAVELPARLLESARDILGRRFEPARESYPEAIHALFRLMMERFVAINQQAFDVGLDLLVFPQGTRSVRLSKGHIGLAQIALHTKRTIVPVSANNCDILYPGGSMMSGPGHVIYRFGEPIPYESLEAYHVPPFEPFTPEAEKTHRARFQALVDHVMDRIDEGLDERHKYNPDRESDGLKDTSRFV